MYSSLPTRLPLPVMLLCALCAGPVLLVGCDDNVQGAIGNEDDPDTGPVDPDRQDNEPPMEMGHPDMAPDGPPDMQVDGAPEVEPDIGGTTVFEDVGVDAGDMVPDRAVDAEPPCAPMATRPCDLDCGDGFQTCAGGEWGACEPLPEICNGSDDDCDGETDEGFGVGDACEAGVGVCRRDGVVACAADGASRCGATPGPDEVEGCNQLDDDCDGLIDEDFGGGAPCTLGLGQCEVPSVNVCIDERIVCFGEADEPAPEGCNGLDDDCDGEIDEDFDPGAECEVGLGPCRAQGVWICGEDGDALCLADGASPALEACNGVDDDCDGEVDEGTIDPAVGGGAPCFEGEGECRTEGGVVCDAAGELRCSAEPGPPIDELCNGLDEDCDGATDEGYRLGAPCTDGAGICARPGVRICSEGGRARCSAEAGPPAEERCNGLDDDCDGEADEGYPLDLRCETGLGVCLTGGRTVCAPDGGDVICEAVMPEPTDERCNGLDDDCDGREDEGFGLGDPCVGGEGACARPGVIDCVADGTAQCAAVEGEPDFEQCDGRDEDCDGAIDEGTGLGGLCAVGIGACARPGELVCDDAGGTRCDGEPGRADGEVCNAIDDDCDGVVDNGVAWAGIPLGGACSRGVGACRADGRVVCDDDDEAHCSAEEGEPADEICNGIDDDCDGEADEGFDLGEGCAVGIGQCLSRGQRICDGDGEATCSAAPGAASPETCNGLDDDCDGATDEDLALDGIPLGERCQRGIGRCLAGGEVVCADGVAVCDAEPGGARPEACNGVDDDCDGASDEAFDLGAGCTEGVGLCARNGVVICGQDGQAACTATAGDPRDELCDGADDDCDGASDEDYVLGQACTLGLGACAADGITVCGPDGAEARCGAQPGAPVIEVCNAIDDDCDGAVDEGLGLGERCAVGLGVCRTEGEQICADNGGVICDVEPGAPGAETCDARDDDCDGSTDEGYDLGRDCVSGLGICARGGVRVCAANGDATCDGVPGDPEDEACNDLDDDCDGIVDEGVGDQAGIAFGLCGPRYRSCLDALRSGGVESGVYRISPEDGAGSEVYCDQTTDGGGWTLVMATAAPPTDGLGTWHDELLDKTPANAHDGVWAGLAHLGDQPFDVRFACRDAQAPGDARRGFDVDLAFYGTPWYRQFIRGGEAASCFATLEDDPVLPARRNIISGEVRSHGQPYPLAAEGRLVGEPSCNAPDIFLVDFDDGGVRGTGIDGTDWGTAVGRGVCGEVVESGQWLVFVREEVPHPLGPIGLINLPQLAVPVEAAGFEPVPLAVDDPGLAEVLDPAILPAVFIGRYAQDWPSVPVGFEDVMGCYTFSGGSVITEFDGFSLFGPRYGGDFVYRQGAPNPWGFLSAVTGGGHARGENSPVDVLDQSDPITRGLGERFRAGGGTERFITIGQVHPSVPIPLETLASFPGDGESFPEARYPALLRGNQCGGSLLVGAFDYADAPLDPSITRLVGNLAAAAVSPPQGESDEFCDGGLGQDRCE